MLASFLFNLYLFHVASIFDGHCHSPKLSESGVPILLYVDGAMIFSQTRFGLKRALQSFSSYCCKKSLVINYLRSKILVFIRSENRTDLNGLSIRPILSKSILLLSGDSVFSRSALDTHTPLHLEQHLIKQNYAQVP